MARVVLAALVVVPGLATIVLAPVPWWFIPSALVAGCFVAWLLVDWIPDNWHG